MESYSLICMPEPLGNHIHFSVMMRGIMRHIFISSVSIESDARQRLSSNEAALHVAKNVQRFVEAAREKAGDALAQSITLDENDRLQPWADLDISGSA